MSPAKFADMLLRRYDQVIRFDEDPDLDAALHEAVTYAAASNLWPADRIARLYAVLKEGWATAGYGVMRRMWVVNQLRSESYEWVYKPELYGPQAEKPEDAE